MPSGNGQPRIYSLSGDTANGQFNTDELLVEIQADPTIVTATRTGANGGPTAQYGDDLSVWFTSDLSAGEITALDAVLAAHQGNSPLDPKFTSSVDFPTTTTKSDVYTTVGNFGFAGSIEIGTPIAIRAVCGVTSATSMDIRVRDVLNNTTVCETTAVTDTFPSVVDLGVINNIPSSAAALEIQIRRNAGSGNQKVSGSSLVLVF